ncbi:MAG TPA: YqhA family protein [Roseiflexaceae bacterium]|nr:YqhA family protein [Roseiflexaceae bacterium]
METHDQPPREGRILPDAHPSRNYALLLRGLAGTRIVFTLAILSTFVAAVTLLVLGAIETFQTVSALVGVGDHAITPAEVRQSFIEVVDLFLVATIMYVISIGLYQLFADSRLPVAPWLKVRSASDLEQKLIGVLITVLGVESLAKVIGWDGQTNLLQYGLTTGLLIAALAYFAVNHHKGQDDSEEQDDD